MPSTMKAANSDIMAGGAGGPRRKSRRSSQSSDDKKPRGRPRVEPQDETAADRRRTQIRLAQRAYRLRKETTIMSLKQRNLELSGVINDMFAALGVLSEKATAGGLENLSSSIFADLTDTERVFTELKERASSNGCDDLDPLEKGSRVEALEAPLDAGPETQSPQQSPQQGGETSCSSHTTGSSPTIVSPEERGVPSVWGYETIQGDKTANTPHDFEVLTDVVENDVAVDGMLCWDELPNRMQLDASVGTFRAAGAGHVIDPNTLPFTHLVAQPDLCANICAPTSLAWQEASFSRQLHRATLEAGAMLIQRQILSPSRFNKKFQLCLPYGCKDGLLSKITKTLRRDASQSLDWEDHPIRHLGGAGMHFARRNDSGHSLPQIGDTPASGALEADMLADLMNTTNQSGRGGQTLSIHGFEGEWFDAQDVEGYLKHKGVRIEPGSNTALLEPTTNLPHGQRVSPSSSLDGMDIFALETRRAKAWPTRNASANLQASVMMDLGDSPPQADCVTQTQSPKAVVDVPLLIQEIIKHATCLGRAPGYRRRDVDRAIKRSLTVPA